MGAQTVTGRGQGSAEATSKGDKNRNFVGVEKLIGPRIVAAGKATLDGAGHIHVNFRVPLPCVTPLSAQAATPTPESDYCIQWIDETSPGNNDLIVLATVNSDATGDTTVAAALQTCLKGFTLTGGTAADVVGWVVVKVGD
jgi:hypothetical protein